MFAWLLGGDPMNKIISIALLFGGIVAFSGSPGHTTIASSLAGELKLAAAPEIQSTPKPTMEVSLIKEFPAAEEKRVFQFQTVNGISLDDSPATVVEKLGKPLTKSKDAFLAEIEVFVYPEMNIGFSSGSIDYVEVLASSGTASIDGTQITIGLEAMKKAFGEPNFVAEDGITFQRNQAVIKIFTDMETKKVTSIHYFHNSNV
jgi:hypothetical protein